MSTVSSRCTAGMHWTALQSTAETAALQPTSTATHNTSSTYLSQLIKPNYEYTTMQQSIHRIRDGK